MDSLVERSAAARFVDINLRGMGQVIFQNNPLTGLLFLAGVTWGSIAAGKPLIAIGAVAATLIATATAMVLASDEESLREGLFGFNGMLVGCAVPTLVTSTNMWLLLIVGAAVSTIVMLAVSHVMKTWGTPALTFPFVLTTWFLVLAAYSMGAITTEGMGPQRFLHATAPATGHEVGLGAAALLEGWLKGPAQVFLVNNWVSGILVVAGLAVASIRAAVFALVGSAVGVVMTLALGGSAEHVQKGLFGFSAVLTAVALGCTFYKPSWRVTLYALLGTIFTVIMQAGLDSALAPLGVPTFTAPFVFATWLFLVPKADLKPHPHAPIEKGVVDQGSAK